MVEPIDASDRPHGWRGWQIALAVAAVAVAAGVAGLVIGRSTSDRDQVSTGSTATSVADTTPAPTETVTTPSSSPTAADDLASFLRAAADTDTQLRTAAASINAHLGPDTITVDETASDALAAADSGKVAARIPAGLSPALLQPVLLVYSDLVSRTRSLVCVGLQVRTVPRSDLPPDCLAFGGPAAARFAADLAALRSTAGAAPPVEHVTPESRAAEELAIRVATIDLQNNGCAGVGGAIATELDAVEIYPHPTVPPGYTQAFDGNVDGVNFTAVYDVNRGWVIRLNAC